MAKKTVAPDPAKLLPILEKILDGETRKLAGAGKSPGVFPGGAGGAALIESAKQLGYIELVDLPAPPPAKGKKAGKPTPGVRITPAGHAFVLDQLSPRKALETLSESLQGLAKGGANTVVETQLAQLQHTVQQVSSAVGAIAQALRDAAERSEQLLKSVGDAVRRATPAAADAAPKPSARPDAGAGDDSLADDAVRLAGDWWAAHAGAGMPLGELYSALREAHAGLSVGRFHDALRALDRARPRRLQLLPWSKALDGIPVPESALFVNSSVMYFAGQPRE